LSLIPGVQAADVEGLVFVAFRRGTTIDISGVVHASAEHLPRLKVELYERAGERLQPQLLRSQQVSLSGAFTFASVPIPTGGKVL
jgi:hypothetical protein